MQNTVLKKKSGQLISRSCYSNLTKKYFILFLVFFVYTTSAQANIVYEKNIEGKPLTITAPLSFQVSENITFYTESGKKDVFVKYDNVTIQTSKVILNDLTNYIDISQNFYSSLDKLELVGQTLIYNPERMIFRAKELYLESDNSIFLGMNRFTIDEDKMVVDKMLISRGNAKIIDNEAIDFLRLNKISIDLSLENAVFYPEWYILKYPMLKVMGIPILYAPTVVYDNSPAAYEMPTPFPQWGYDSYRQNFWRENIHYFFNEHQFGSVQFGHSQKKGNGFGLFHVYKIDPYNQFFYLNENWQYADTQEEFRYKHSFSKMAFTAEDNFFKRREKFFEGTGPKRTLEVLYTKREEEGNEVINRLPEYKFEGDFNIPISSFSIYNLTSYASIEELSTGRSGNKGKVHNQISHPLDIPFLKSTSLGLGYDTIHYNKEPFYWYQLYDYLSIKYQLGVFNAEAKITDYLKEEGSSPFKFDQPAIKSDYVRSQYFFTYEKVTVGKGSKYAIYDGKVSDIIYYIHIRQSSWSMKVEHNSIAKSWWAGFYLDLF